MSIVKFRPTLTSNEIQDIIRALEQSNPGSSALATMKLYAYKQSLGLVKPATISSAPVETEEEKQARIDKELEEAANYFKNASSVVASNL